MIVPLDSARRLATLFPLDCFVAVQGDELYAQAGAYRYATKLVDATAPDLAAVIATTAPHAAQVACASMAAAQRRALLVADEHDAVVLTIRGDGVTVTAGTGDIVQIVGSDAATTGVITLIGR